MRHFLGALLAVGSAFVGIRRQRAAVVDWTNFRPHHIIIAGIVATALFVAALVIIVQLIV